MKLKIALIALALSSCSDNSRSVDQFAGESAGDSLFGSIAGSDTSSEDLELARQIKLSDTLQRRAIDMPLQANFGQKASVAGLMVYSAGYEHIAPELNALIASRRARSFEPRSPLETNVTVVDKSVDADSTSMMVDFRWNYVNLPDILAFLAVRGGTGRASFRKFETGWKLMSLEESIDFSPYEMNATQLAAMENFQSNAANLSERLIESLRPNTTLSTLRYPYPKGGGGYSNSRKDQIVELTDKTVSFATAWEEKKTIWFGHINAIEVRDQFYFSLPSGKPVELWVDPSRADWKKFEGQLRSAVAAWNKKYPDVKQRFGSEWTNEMRDYGVCYGSC